MALVAWIVVGVLTVVIVGVGLIVLGLFIDLFNEHRRTKE